MRQKSSIASVRSPFLLLRACLSKRLGSSSSSLIRSSQQSQAKDEQSRSIGMKQCCGFLDDDSCMLLLQILVKIFPSFLQPSKARANLRYLAKPMATMIIIKWWWRRVEWS